MHESTAEFWRIQLPLGTLSSCEFGYDMADAAVLAWSVSLEHLRVACYKRRCAAGAWPLDGHGQMSATSGLVGGLPLGLEKGRETFHWRGWRSRGGDASASIWLASHYASWTGPIE